jgi:hypothetical protein
MIGGKAPCDYLKQIQGHKNVQLDDAGMDAILVTHQLDPSFMRSNDFNGFIEARRQLLVHKISEVMGKPVVATGEELAEDESDED